MKFIIRNIFLMYAVVSTVVCFYHLSTSNWSWISALDNGAREVLFSILVVSLGIRG
jgi:hypothetical protein